MADSSLNAVVQKRIEIAPGLIILRVEPAGWELPEFKAGQYAVLGLPGSARRTELSDPEEKIPDADKIIKRPYSIASSSMEKRYLELYITLIRSGILTPRLFDLKEGDEVFMSDRYKGLFTLDQVPEEANIVMVSTGTGIAPYMSMIRTEYKIRPNRRFALIHGARHSWDLGYRAELSTLDYYFDGFVYRPTISRPDDEKEGWTGHTGYVQDLWRKTASDGEFGFAPTPDDTHIFLCGAPAMVEEMVELLTDSGYREHKKKAPGQIHVERFW